MRNKENFPKAANEQIENLDNYMSYPPNEDIYNKFNKEFDIDPEDISKKKSNETIDIDDEWKEMNFNVENSGDDLDIPGSDLDDEQENIGSEDEENNYYSIGGDNHNDLEEDNQ